MNNINWLYQIMHVSYGEAIINSWADIFMLKIKNKLK